MEAYILQLKNIFDHNALEDWALDIKEESKYFDRIVSTQNQVGSTQHPLWVSSISNNEFRYYTTDNLLAAICHIICEHCNTLNTSQLSQINLGTFKGILSFFDVSRIQDAQRLINQLKKLAVKY